MKDYDLRKDAVVEIKICLARVAAAVGEYKKSVLYYEEAGDVLWQCIKGGDITKALTLLKIFREYIKVRKKIGRLGI